MTSSSLVGGRLGWLSLAAALVCVGMSVWMCSSERTDVAPLDRDAPAQSQTAQGSRAHTDHLPVDPAQGAEVLPDMIARQIEQTRSLGGYRSVFIPSERYDAARATNDSNVNPTHKPVTPEQRQRLIEILEAHNPAIVREETRMAELAESALRESARRGEYRIVQTPPTDKSQAAENRKATLAELDAIYGAFREGYWYQSFSGQRFGESIILFFTKGDCPEFLRLLQHVRQLREIRSTGLRDYFSIL